MKRNLILLGLIMSAILQAQDQGITSEVHRQNVNKIVFANNRADLAFKKEKPHSIKTTFSASENIYGRAYTDKSIQRKSKGLIPGFLLYDLHINGQQIGHQKSFGMYKHLRKKTYYTEVMEDDESWSSWTSWKVWLLPTMDDNELKYGNVNIAARAFVMALLEQSAGTHQIKLDIYHINKTGLGKPKHLCSGEFELTLTQADINRLQFAYAAPLPPDEYTGSDKATVVADIEKAFTRELNKKPITCGIYKHGWNEGVYTMTGGKYRKIAGWAVFEDTDGDGKVPITTFNFISDYSNGGWTQLRFDSHCLGCANHEVDVEAVKANL